MKKMLHLSLFLKIASIVAVSLIVTNLLTVMIATNITKKLFSESFTLLNDRIMEQVRDNFNNYNTQIVSSINTYRQNPSLKEVFTQDIVDQNRLFRVFYEMKSYMKSVEKSSVFPTYNTLTLGANGNFFVAMSDEPIYTKEEYMQMPLTQMSVKNPHKLFYRYSNTGLTRFYKDKDVIIAVKQLIDPYSAVNFGTIFIVIDENSFCDMYANCVTEGSDVLMLSSDGTVVSSNVKSTIGSQLPSLLDQARQNIESGKSSSDFDYNGAPCTLIAKYLPVYDMYITNIVNKDYLLRDFRSMLPLLMSACFFVICAATILVFGIARRVTNPIRLLMRQMKKSRDGEFLKIEEITGSYEVRELQLGYNQMVEEIDLYVDRLVTEQERRRRSEITALQMQINPHFIYNTLASIKFLSWQGNNNAVTETINALIRLLQNVVGEIDQLIPVSEELENLKSYVAINHMRYGDDIKVYYDVAEECLNCRVPKLIIQPFIENSFFHAFQQKRSGSIHIFMRCKEEYFICEVIDNGSGMTEAECRKIAGGEGKNHFSGIGIHNVDERIKLIYGESCGVRITSEIGVGTTVTITMAARFAENGET
ncbi:sensor histidine kinase [Hydrogenoanaerobacterium sp.]|uniref:sensor histidine kinase n=1 Tax=Hydrogenoanaerobacterium sp. TaxID=2953763 RepID=UPI00289E59FC|nr:sensor histidine kinase [Hydrogenoanaerobacterium sp.]